MDQGPRGETGREEAGVDIVTTPQHLELVAARAARAPKLAVDTEANGLFAFEARLCVVQLAWREGERDVVAIVDALATPLDALAGVMGDGGPPKVLHDLTFDARLLASVGLALARVIDTEVCARLLGRPALGLASLLGSELGISLSKALQRHDWSRRPLLPAHVAYLAGDVEHLLRLEELLSREADSRDLLPEIRSETTYKLETAAAKEGDGRPAWARAKGSADLDGLGRAILRCLLEEREAAARRLDVPPFHVIGSRELVAVAARRPRTYDELVTCLGRWVAKWPAEARRFLDAIERGHDAGDVPDEERQLAFPPPPPRAVSERRRRMEQAVSAWRRREAATRAWPEQAVLPGHCARELATLLADAANETVRRAAIPTVRGLGERRQAWFTDAWLELGRTVLDLPPSPPE